MKINVKNFSKVVKAVVVKYVIGLILSQNRKTCPAIASILGINHDSIYRYLSNNTDLVAFFPDLAIKLANHFHSIKPGWLIIDDTALSKNYAKYIEGIHWVYNSSIGKPELGLCIVVAAWSNGDVTIPIAFDWWFSKTIVGTSYEKKNSIAQRLISNLKGKINFERIISDAAYFSIEMLIFHESLLNKYINRLNSGRKVTTQSGLCEQVKNHPDLKLKRNERAKITKIRIGQIDAYVVTFKRPKRDFGEYEIVYLITNIYANPYTIIQMYEGRWHIEPMFRTMKQALGLMLCQSRGIKKQDRHVHAVFLSFAYLQHEKYEHNLACAEDAIRSLQAAKITATVKRFVRFCQDFQCVA